MKTRWIAASVFALGVAGACGADPIFEDERDSIFSFGKSGDFENKRTYYMPSQVNELCIQPSAGTPSSEALGGAAGGSSLSGACRPPDHGFDSVILDSFERNMDALGYERVSTEAEADLALLVNVVSVEGFWSLNRPFCYPEYFFAGCSDAVTTEEIFIPEQGHIAQLVDLSGTSGEQLDVIWTTAFHLFFARYEVRGTAVSGGEAEAKVISEGIDVAFAQSPYLAEGGN